MKVLLVDDHMLFAKSLEIALEGNSCIESFTSIQNIGHILEDIYRLSPDIILMDINLNQPGGEDGLSLSRQILKAFPQQKLVMLSGYDLPVYRRESCKIGAKGFISKAVFPEELLNVLQIIYKGNTYFPNTDSFLEELTLSEKEVLQLLAEGWKRKEIANRLFLSERTVSNHLQHVFDKLQVSSSVEAVSKGLQLGYIPPV